MATHQVKVIFQPFGRTVYVLEGTKIIEAAAQAGLTINTPCGGAGTCGRCRVKIYSGADEPSEYDKDFFNNEDLKEGWRLACQNSVRTDTVATIPENSLLTSQHKIVIESHTKKSAEIMPAVRKLYVELPPPTMENNMADLLRLEKAIGNFKIDLFQLRSLPKLLRQYNYKGTAVLADHNLVDFESGDTTNQCYGVAFDIGTTTIVGYLINLSNGSELAVNSQMNPQISFGDDVLSRISHASSCSGCLDELHNIIRNAVNEMIEKLCEQADISREYIYEVAVAGNTTMEHLLCRIDPSPLGKVPFVPAHARGLIFDAKDIGVSINHHGKIYIFPIIGGFVGGDTVAGILVTNLSEEKGVSLLIDIGTNGEIVLAKNGQLLAASTAAGPAFEGARISYGMRATTGAIEKIVFDDDLRYSVIDNSKAVGICGSALIDLIAEMLNCGIITSTGQMLEPDQLPEQLPAALRQRIYQNRDGQTEFLISQSNQGRKDLRVILTQRDIREFQLAIGAIRAGINIMLKIAKVEIKDIDRVLIAGGFGSFIRRTNAQRIGLLPAGIDHQKINYIGNASLAGAKWVLLSSNARRYAEEIARKAEHIELSLDTNFQMEFAEAMIFPNQ
jgi:uncharacterized 2Fe-2S/4Fe-4S cluster protein (DUF4445 family)